MSDSQARNAFDTPNVRYYVDEAGDGVLFGPRGRSRLEDSDARRFFILGMVQVDDPLPIEQAFNSLRSMLLSNPLYASIPSLQPEAGKTAKYFHAKDDHPEIRAKVFDLLLTMDFKFYAVIKDMHAVLEYVKRRNQMHAEYRYKPDELYDLTVRMLFKQRLHVHSNIDVTFARRGKSDRTDALRKQLEAIQAQFTSNSTTSTPATLTIKPANSCDVVGLQIADYALWALQRCYESYEARFLHALWPKVSLIHDVDDKMTAKYGRYWTRKNSPPDPEAIKNRWI